MWQLPAGMAKKLSGGRGKSQQIWLTNGDRNGRLKFVAQASHLLYAHPPAEFSLLQQFYVFFNFGFYVVPRIVLIRCGQVRPALDRQIAWGKINECQLVLVGRGKQTNDWQKCLQFNVELERSRSATKHKKKTKKKTNKQKGRKKSLDHLYVPLLVLFCLAFFGFGFGVLHPQKLRL